MEGEIKKALGTSKFKSTGIGGGGCISEGEAYETDSGVVFVKRNSKAEAKQMFEGELEGLNGIFATQTIRVPKPIRVVDSPNGTALVMEYINMTSLSKYSEELGELLAKLHLYNENIKTKSKSSVHKVEDEDAGNRIQHINQFGFHVTTCCGYIPQDNSWKNDWVEFYTQQRLQQQIRMLEVKHENRELLQLWSELQLKIPDFFKDMEITPALLHGDLWSGNAAQTDDGPVVFDPATFYGHSEFDLAIAGMFGGFSHSFYTAYHNILPQAPGFSKRLQLYQLFHYLNHWNHFGSGYKSSSIYIMKQILK